MHDDPVELLRSHGAYVTAQRVAVLHAVGGSAHTTADEVLQQVRLDLGTISRQSVYDALNTLTELGLLRRIQPSGSAARFETRTGDNHHHVVCRTCGRVEDVDCAVGARPCLTASDDHGFTIDEADVVYWGLCPACRNDTGDPSTHSSSQSATDTPEGTP